MIPRTSDTVDICAHIYMKIEGMAPTSVATVRRNMGINFLVALT